MSSRKIALLWTCLLSAAFLAIPARLGASSPLKSAYDPLIREIAERHGLDPALVHCIIAAESDYNRFAVSAKGALGLMQLMPETARQYGVKNVFDAGENIEGGVKFLKDLQKTYDRQTDLILAAYNAGREAVTKYDGVPPFAETESYVGRVKRLYARESGGGNKTRIFSFRDSRGRLVITNDIRLLASGPKSQAP